MCNELRRAKENRKTAVFSDWGYPFLVKLDVCETLKIPFHVIVQNSPALECDDINTVGS